MQKARSSSPSAQQSGIHRLEVNEYVQSHSQGQPVCKGRQYRHCRPIDLDIYSPTARTRQFPAARPPRDLARMASQRYTANKKHAAQLPTLCSVQREAVSAFPPPAETNQISETGGTVPRSSGISALDFSASRTGLASLDLWISYLLPVCWSPMPHRHTHSMEYPHDASERCNTSYNTSL